MGREWRVRCPVHEADGAQHNPSFAVWTRPTGEVAFNCMGGCKYPVVVAALERLGLPVTNTSSPEERTARKAASDAHRTSGMLAARELFSTCYPIEASGAVDRYLKSRRLDLDEHEKRFLLEAPDPSVRNGKLFVGLIVDLSTLFDEAITLVGVQALPVDAGGKAALGRNGKKWRQITGTLRGCGVPIGRPSLDGRIVVGEGIETVLAAKRLLDMPFGIASLSSSNMPALKLPKGTTSVMISADNDPAGAEAANAAMRLWSRDVKMRAVVWGNRGDDAASEWIKRQPVLE
jgi:hypothetical protein